jgi:hypothetical protein
MSCVESVAYSILSALHYMTGLIRVNLPTLVAGASGACMHMCNLEPVEQLRVRGLGQSTKAQLYSLAKCSGDQSLSECCFRRWRYVFHPNLLFFAM